jgi:hypothetical protein
VTRRVVAWGGAEFPDETMETNNMWPMIKAYAAARWAEPETKLALTTTASVTAAALLGHWGVIPARVSLGVMYTTDVASAITAALPGPISSAILKQIFGSDVPPTAALRYHAEKMKFLG